MNVVSPRIGVTAPQPSDGTRRGNPAGSSRWDGAARPNQAGREDELARSIGVEPGASTRPARAAHREMALTSDLPPGASSIRGGAEAVDHGRTRDRREVSPGTSRAGQSAQRLSDMSSGAQAARHGPPRKGPWPDGTGPGLAPPSPTAHRRPQNPLGLPVGTGERDEPLRSFRERPAPPARPRPPTTATLTHPTRHLAPLPSRTPRQDLETSTRKVPSGGALRGGQSG